MEEEAERAETQLHETTMAGGVITAAHETDKKHSSEVSFDRWACLLAMVLPAVLRTTSGAKDWLVTDTAINALRRAQFDVSEIIRRAQGDVVGAFGLNPQESPHQIITSRTHWRLRDYGGDDRSRSLLIIAAPIKRPYIWDLAPPISAIRFCLRQGLYVQLLEWMPASPNAGNCGLDEYVLAISEAVATITTAAQGAKPSLIGHSLGGTLAAMYGALFPESITSLVLLGAPLCFEPSENQFRDALVRLVPQETSDADPFPGALLSHASALASPRAFISSRLMGAAMSIVDPLAMAIHARVERWALDEMPLPGKLVHQIIEWLYRENRFCGNKLKIGEKFIGPSTVPTLAVINTADDVAPLNSLKPFADAMAKNVRIIEYPGELGVCLQHLGILVGRHAQADVWPEILSWLKSQTSSMRA
jgi:polyhydroxyalkanoate synthase subunit PhaC